MSLAMEANSDDGNVAGAGLVPEQATGGEASHENSDDLLNY